MEDVGVAWERRLNLAASETSHSFVDQLRKYYDLTDGELCCSPKYGSFWGSTTNIKILACTALD